MFTFLVFLSAFLLEGIGTYVSVVGLGALFAYSPVVMIMAIALDIAKVVNVTFLYRHWKQLGMTMRGYLLSATLVLMMITSSGVFGYLSGEFQKAIAGNTQSTVVIKSLEDEQGRLQKRKEEIDKQISQLPQNNVRGRRQLMQQFGPEVDRLNGRLVEIDQELPKLKVANIEKDSHVGPIMYVAEAFETTPQKAVFWVILTIIFVFDPLAVALLVAGNFLLALRKEEKIIEKTVEGFSGPPILPSIAELSVKEDTRKFETQPEVKTILDTQETLDSVNAMLVNDLPPIHIDRERMDKALAGSTYTLPQGLSSGEMIEHITKAAHGEIEPDVVNHDMAMESIMNTPHLRERLESEQVPEKKKRKYVRKEKLAPVEPEREKVVIKAPPKKPRAVTVEQKDNKEVIKLEPVSTSLERVDGRQGDVFTDTNSKSNNSGTYR